MCVSSERILDGQVMEMKMLAEPVLEVAAGVFVGALDVDPEQAALVVDRFFDPIDRPVGVEDARAVAVAEMDDRFARGGFDSGGEDMGAGAESRGSSRFSRSAVILGRDRVLVSS